MYSFFDTETITVVGERIAGGGITDPWAIRDFLDNWGRDNGGVGNYEGGGGGGGNNNDNNDQDSGE